MLTLTLLLCSAAAAVSPPADARVGTACPMEPPAGSLVRARVHVELVCTLALLLINNNNGLKVCQHGQTAPLGRAWQLWAAQHSQGEAQPLGAQPPPWVLELAASKAADFTAFEHSGLQPWGAANLSELAFDHPRLFIPKNAKPPDGWVDGIYASQNPANCTGARFLLLENDVAHAGSP
eukprot:scaffold62734_cov36-Phaeocystis_antarctica.AAC.1